MPSLTDTTRQSANNEYLADPEYPLFIVSNQDCVEEMVSRECAAVQLNLLKVALTANAEGPREIQGVPLAGRSVFLAFDELIAGIPKASRAITDLTSYLRQQGASVASFSSAQRTTTAP